MNLFEISETVRQYYAQHQQSMSVATLQQNLDQELCSKYGFSMAKTTFKNLVCTLEVVLNGKRLFFSVDVAD